MPQDPFDAAWEAQEDPFEAAWGASVATEDPPQYTIPMSSTAPLAHSTSAEGQDAPGSPPAGPTGVSEAVRSVGRGAAQAGIGVAQGGLLAQEAFDRVTEALWERLLGEDVEGVHGARETATKLQAVKEGVLPARGERGFWTHTTPEALGSALTFMLGGAATGGSALGIAGMGAASGFADGFYDAVANGATEEEAWTSAAANGGLGLTEAVPLGKLLARFNRGTGGSLRTALTRMLTEGTEEAVQEVIQGAGSNIVAKGLYDEEREILSGLAEGGAAGFFVGALLSVASSGAAKARGQIKANEAQEGAGRTEPVGGDDSTAPVPSSPIPAAAESGQPVTVTVPEGNLMGLPPGEVEAVVSSVDGNQTTVRDPESGQERVVPTEWVGVAEMPTEPGLFGEVEAPAAASEAAVAPEPPVRGMPSPDQYDTLHPMAGAEVSGLRVGKVIKNTSSIESSFTESYEVPGVREVPMSAFEDQSKPKPHSVSEARRLDRLVAEIKESGRIDPLIVAYDEKGPYILEGGHRFDALKVLGVESFPAVVVFDESDASAPEPAVPGAEVGATPPAEGGEAEPARTPTFKSGPPPETPRPVQAGTPDPSGRQITVPEEGRADKIIREVHDYMQSWVRAEEAAGDVPDKASPVLTETLRRGRSKVRMEELQEKHLRPVLSDLREGKVTLEEFEEYLYARHAPERNKTIQEINPDVADGSGMSDAEAEKIIAKVKEDPRFTAFRAAARKFDRMNLAVLDNAVKDGLMSSEDAANLRERWQHYAPLRHLEGEEGAFTGTGQGVQTRGREFKRALGRESKAQHILSFAVTQAQREILRGEKAKVGQAVGRFLRMFDPGQEIATISPKQVMRGIRADGTVGMVTDPRFKDADNVYTYKEGGAEKVIEFAPEYQDFATGLKNLDAKEANRAVQVMRKYVRLLSGMFTRHNPAFAPINALRDAQHSLLTGTAEGGVGFGARVFLRLPLTWKAIAAESISPGGETTDPMRLSYRKYVEAGAPISFLDLGDVSETERSIQRDLEAARGGSREALKRAAFRFVGAVDAMNDLFENGARLSAFHEKLQAGWSDERAAQYAKNFTTNFEKRGSKTQNLNAFYMFAQAGINGTARIVLPLAKGHKGMRKMAGSVVALGVLAELYNYMIAGDDEEGENRYYKIPQWERDLNTIIMFADGSGRYAKLPKPYVWSWFFNLGANATRLMVGRQSLAEASVHIAKSGIDNFSPIGGDDNMLTMALPTVADPWAAIYTNEKWTGSAIYRPKEYRGDRAAADLGMDRTPAFYKELAKAMERATAGGAAKKGWVDIPPEAIQYLIEQHVGGVGQEIERLITIGARLATGGDVEARDVPVVRRLYGSPNEYQTVERYREIADEIRFARTALKDAAEAGNEARAASIREEAGAILALDGLLRAAESIDRKVDSESPPEALESLREAQKALIRAYNRTKRGEAKPAQAITIPGF